MAVVVRNRCDDGQRGLGDDIGRVEPAAEPGLQKYEVGRRAGEGEKCRRRGDLEKG